MTFCQSIQPASDQLLLLQIMRWSMAWLALKLFNFMCLHVELIALCPQMNVGTKKYRDARLMTLISNRMKKVHLLLRSVVNQLFELLPFTWYIFLFPMKFLETTIFPNPPTFYNEQLIFHQSY
jgi:hypothetical protein